MEDWQACRFGNITSDFIKWVSGTQTGKKEPVIEVNGRVPGTGLE